ncbi:unnamed protein product [Eretmochelys imbricata]
MVFRLLRRNISTSGGSGNISTSGGSGNISTSGGSGNISTCRGSGNSIICPGNISTCRGSGNSIICRAFPEETPGKRNISTCRGSGNISTCRGSGNNSSCSGSGKISFCHFTGYNSSCRGSGKISFSHVTGNISTCRGSGNSIICRAFPEETSGKRNISTCRGSGNISTCRGSGNNSSCSGSGKISFCHFTGYNSSCRGSGKISFSHVTGNISTCRGSGNSIICRAFPEETSGKRRSIISRDIRGTSITGTAEPALLEQTVKAIFAFYAQKIKKTLNEMEREDAASLEKKPDREREKKEELKWKLEWLQKVEPVVINIVLNLSGLGNVLTSQQITFMKGLANLVDGRIQRANDEAEVTAVVSEAAKEGDHLLHRKSAELLGRDESKKLKQSLDQMAGSYSSLVQSGFRETEFSKEFSAYADRCGPEIFQPS